MHFSKAYTELLSTLPPELKTNVFDYRKLKRLINQTVSELDSLGLGHPVLQALRELQDQTDDPTHLKRQDATLTVDPKSVSDVSHGYATLTYEIAWYSTVPEPRLRLSLKPPSDAIEADDTHIHAAERINLHISDQLFDHIRAALHYSSIKKEISLHHDRTDAEHVSDLIVPLPSDAAFLRLLTSTISSLAGNSDTLLDDFRLALTNLAASISLTALPVSSSAPESFFAYSPIANNAVALRPSPGGKSDLYIWREIFHLYVEAHVFECIRETKSTQPEKSVENVERQLAFFRQLIQDKKVSLVLPASKDALDVFLNLNIFILNVKMLQRANSEATRKILKKHAKRTTLPIPAYLLEPHVATSAIVSRSLPRLLVQAIGEVLLPIIPVIDDYSCIICTYVAFKPIRLGCGHFFCVRCLAKLQRRGMDDCPLCRAPTVLRANPSNIDYGLLNFIADWFPVESREKQHANEVELAREQQEYLCMDDAHGCRIM